MTTVLQSNEIIFQFLNRRFMTLEDVLNENSYCFITLIITIYKLFVVFGEVTKLGRMFGTQFHPLEVSVYWRRKFFATFLLNILSCM